MKAKTPFTNGKEGFGGTNSTPTMPKSNSFVNVCGRWAAGEVGRG